MGHPSEPDPYHWQAARLRMRDATIKAAVSQVPVIALECRELGLEPLRLLKAIATVESECGAHLDPVTWLVKTRLEPGYSPGGTYYLRSSVLRRGWERWSKAAGSSHGPWQTLWITAVEHGFSPNVDPLDDDQGLGLPLHNAEIVSRVLYGILSDIRRERRRGNPGYLGRTALSLVGDAYNSGSIGGYLPRGYIETLNESYAAHTNEESYP